MAASLSIILNEYNSLKIELINLRSLSYDNNNYFKNDSEKIIFTENVSDILNENADLKLEIEKFKNKLQQCVSGCSNLDNQPTEVIKQNTSLIRQVENLNAEIRKLKYSQYMSSSSSSSGQEEATTNLSLPPSSTTTTSSPQQDNELNVIKANYNKLMADHEIVISQREKLVEFLYKIFNFTTKLSIDDMLEKINLQLSKVDNSLRQLTQENYNLKSRNNILEKTSVEKENKLINMIETIDKNIQREINNIDTELTLYNNDNDDDNNDNNYKKLLTTPLDYNINEPINEDYIPLLERISIEINKDVVGNDFKTEEAKNPDVRTALYHTYMIFIIKLTTSYSKNYIRKYLSYIYNEYFKKINTEQNVLEIPHLIQPQTLQINSLYYLMNRYNSKSYQPDRVYDFGDFIFQLLRTEFRTDTTQALNLFQPNIGKRYNSILLYTPETMEKLSNFKTTLENII